MKTIQEEIAPIGQALKIVLGRNPDDENDMSLYGGAAHIEAASKLIRILGNAGLEENGEAADLTDKKVMRAIRPGDLALMVNACFDAMNEGMKSEIPEKKETGPVDVTLEEMKKKETRDG
jgi:hypothetical protein